MNMDKLMRPNSIVVVGATDKKGMAGGATQSSIKGMNKDRVYYLNPRREELFGRKCYHSLAELPEVPDCMLICTPSHTIIPYMEEAGIAGIGAAVVLASGFSEERSEEARELSRKLYDVCKEYDIALCGPNCIGIVNGIDNICVTANNDETMTMLADDQRRGVGVIAQSGYISSGFNNPDCDHLAMVVSAGNSLICGLEDYMLYMAQEDRINCIAAYIEGITKPEVLIEALQIAASKRKPVVVLKAGSSSKGGFAAASHTGSMAGSYRITESVFRKFGVIVTESLEDLVSTSRMFAVLDGNYPAESGMAGINFSGGENTLCADTSERNGIFLPDFSSETLNIIKSIVPPFATPANPLDATTSLFSERALVNRLFTAISEDPCIGLIAVGNDVGLHSEPKDLTCADVLTTLQKNHILKPCVIIPSFEKARNGDVRKTFESSGIPVLATGEYAYKSIRHLMDYISYDSDKVTLECAIPNLKGGILCQKHSLSEKVSKEIMKEAGIPVPEQILIKNESELNDFLQQQTISYPLVMKIDSDDISHKSEAGGVRLNINTREQAINAYSQILKDCQKYNSAASINGILIEEQVEPGEEFIIGITSDPTFGPALLCGSGGTRAELLNDSAIYPCPLGKEEAVKMLLSLKIAPLFKEFRNEPALDIDALSDLMVRLSDYAVAHKNDLSQLDLNPVIVHEAGKGVCAVDALIVLNSEEKYV